MSQKKFKTEVNQLLHLLIHSLYSHPEIFLRELISNSSDALDKLKYLTLSDDVFKTFVFDPRVDIKVGSDDQNTLTISDTGIGMNADELAENLGTIARSGTKRFLENLSGDASKDSNLIGQFGVGFYSCFMVAEKVEVLSRKAGEEQAWLWSSDGKEGFSIKEAQRETPGTSVILYLNEEGKEFSSRWRIDSIVKKYSNHIAFPIFVHYTETTGDKDKGEEKTEEKVEQINAASALWKRSRNEIKEEEYKEFYKSISHDFDDPLMTIHTHAEGTLEYTTLFFIPEKAPFDMYQADYRPGTKLYVRRVFITDDSKELLPPYLRFVRGIIDSEDLPLNVSRELLQKNRVLASIKGASTKKILSELERVSTSEPEKYEKFIGEFNRPLKEGLYSDFENKETLQELIRFKSTVVDGWTSLADYKDRMKEDQKTIFIITGNAEESLRRSPLLEAYKEKNIEVLLMCDEVDEIISPALGPYKELPIKAVNRSDSAEELQSDEDKAKGEEVKDLIDELKKALGERVKDVVPSSRLTNSPACVVADKDDPTAQLQQMMKAMGQGGGMPDIKPILEVNPSHPIILKLNSSKDADIITDAAHLLLDQSLLSEGLPVEDPVSFVKRMNKFLEEGLT